MAIISFKVVNKKKQQVYMAKSQTWQDPNKHVIASKHQEQLIQVSMFIFIIKHMPYACSCECMTYLTYFTTSQHLCINGWTCECMLMVKQRKHKRKP